MAASVSTSWRRILERRSANTSTRREQRAVARRALGRRWGTLFGIAWSLGFAVPAPAAKIQADKDALRKLVSLPPMSFTAEVSTARGLLRWRQELAAPEQIARLRKDLRDDPSDAPRLLQLGRLLNDADHTNQAAVAYSNAVAAFRQQVQSRPNDAHLVCGLGEALANTSQPVEAEAMLRRAVAIAPRDPECWTQLGLFLSDSSRPALYPENVPEEIINSSIALLTTKYKPTPGQFERAEKLARGSIECFDHVTTLAPKDPAGFERRACGLSFIAFIRTIKEQITAPDPDRLTPALTLACTPFSAECLPDLRRAAELDSENPSLVAAVAFAEAMGGALAQAIKKGGSGSTLDRLWDALTADQAQSVQAKMNRLAQLAESPSPKQAASALMFLGVLHSLVMGDQAAAEVRLRRAVALDPRNQQAWEALMVTLNEENRYEEMVKVGESLVKAIDSPRSHLCLAKAHEKLSHWDKVLEQAQVAVKESPNDLTAKLAMASAQIRLSDKDLQQAGVALLKVRIDDFKEADTAVRTHGVFLCGLFLALDDQPEQARPLFQQVLKLEPNHDEAKKALAIVESWK
jgi:tetratricopeptide (TPR) repeat protein